MTLLDGAAARVALAETLSGPRRDLSAPAVQVRGLRRTYGQGPSAYEAVRGVDLDVPAGSITALLGTNGAGKTSTLEVIEGLAPATARRDQRARAGPDRRPRRDPAAHRRPAAAQRLLGRPDGPRDAAPVERRR